MGLLIHNIHNVQTTYNYFDLAPNKDKGQSNEKQELKRGRKGRGG
jgi:hypothetical protein